MRAEGLENAEFGLERTSEKDEWMTYIVMGNLSWCKVENQGHFMKWEWSKPIEYLRRQETECTVWLRKAAQEAAGHSNSLAPKTEETKDRRKKREGKERGREGREEKRGKGRKENSERHGSLRFVLNFKPNIEEDKDHVLEAPVLREHSIKEFQSLKQIIFFPLAFFFFSF